MTDLAINVVSSDELSADASAEWRRLQSLSPELRHPMLAPAFTQTIGRHRQGVRVAVLSRDGGYAGFFPFQEDREGAGLPVAHRLNDCQTVLLESGVQLDTQWLLRACGLRVWQFDNLLPLPAVFPEGRFRVEDAPYIDLSEGSRACLEAISGASRWKTLLRKQRRLEREVGPVRFAFHCADAAAFALMLEWKSQQKRRTGRRDVFSWPWVRPALEELRSQSDPDCVGTFSVLYAGDTVAAIHLGLRSREILHWWIPTYNPELSRYSPGSLLLARLVEEAAAQGLARIDLGKGSEPYKTEFRSGVRLMAAGAVTTNRWDRLLLRGSHLLEARLHSSAAAAPLRRLRHWLDRRSNRRATSDVPGWQR
jgi:CelD/BcsL family acetyltransferase involved in cellulose biosynthesis